MAIESKNSAPENSSSNPNPWDRLGIDVPFASENPQPAELTPSATLKTLPNLPTKSPNHMCSLYLREIEHQDRADDIKAFLESTLSREPHRFSSEAAPELNDFCISYSNQLSSILSPEDKTALKNYSGLGYKAINQVARGYWDYNLLGPQTPEKVATAEQSISQISHAISVAPTIDTDLITHRGANLDSFQGYSVNSLSDLAKLEGQFFLETGFTSTSLTPDRSFTDRKFDDPLRRTCDIAVEYLIPTENRETIGLLSNETSYNPEQRELLIDKGSLSYISNVNVSPDQTSAKLEMILIPRQIYDPATR